MRVLAIQQTLDVQDGENPMHALKKAYLIATGLLEQLHGETIREAGE